MNRSHRIPSISAWLLATVLGLSSLSAIAEHDHGRVVARVSTPNVHLQIDARHGHNRYYPPTGAVYHRLPGDYYAVHYHGSPYYFRGGIWYRPYGGYYVVARAPIGAFITVLPPFYTTVWFGGIPYYYADNVYYRWDTTQNGYIVSDAPGGAINDSAGDVNTTTPGDVFVYPKNGQSTEQQTNDRYECHRWAADQTGFDPTKVSGGVDANASDSKRGEYQRAQAACLDARGYSVK